jgi:hypothetical protein
MTAARPQLSFSSMKTALSCERRYFYAKVEKATPDKDYEESDSLGLGKAFHQVLELTKHESFNDALIMGAMKQHNVRADEKELLTAMLENYIEVHKLSGLKVTHCEIRLEAENFIGFIDFIAQDKDGWWMGDNKTAGRHDPSIIPRLPMDAQLNLYAFFADRIADTFQMKGKFLGFRYRQSIKSKAKTAKGLKDGTPTYDIVVPASMLKPSVVWGNFLDVYDTVLGLHNGMAPKPNYNACMEYFNSCPYFSKCHGHCFSEPPAAIQVLTKQAYEAADLLE